MPTDEQRRTACLQISRQLARSGRYKDHVAIEAALAPVYNEAAEWFRDLGMLDELDEACGRAKEADDSAKQG